MLETWIKQYPEISTRPVLLQELVDNRKFRPDYFKAINDLVEIPKTIHHRLTKDLCGFIYKHGKEKIEKWQSYLEDKDKHIFNQSISAYRNVFVNTMRKLKGDVKSLRHTKKHGYDVVKWA